MSRKSLTLLEQSKLKILQHDLQSNLKFWLALNEIAKGECKCSCTIYESSTVFRKL